MSTVIPKLLFCNITHSQIPVWEIVSEKGKLIYYERVKREGYRPLGIRDTIYLAGTPIHVCDVVQRQGSKTVYVLKEKDGYSAPMSWYERDPDAKLSAGPCEVEPETNYDYQDPVFDDESDGSL